VNGPQISIRPRVGGSMIPFKFRYKQNAGE
jgi:hypothetical protein